MDESSTIAAATCRLDSGKAKQYLYPRLLQRTPGYLSIPRIPMYLYTMKNSKLEDMLDDVATNVKDLTRSEIRKAVTKAVEKTLLRQELDAKRDRFRRNNYKGQVQ